MKHFAIILFALLFTACAAPAARPGAAPNAPPAIPPITILTVDTRGFVMLRNLATAPINLRGFILRSGTGESWTVPADFELAPYKTVRIHAGTGKDNATDLYAGLGGNAWGTLRQVDLLT